MVTPSSGVHVTLPDYYSPENLGMIVPKTKDGRVVFMLPWKEATIAGTTGDFPVLALLQKTFSPCNHAVAGVTQFMSAC